MAVVISSIEGRCQGSPELGGSRLRMPEYGRFSTRGVSDKHVVPASRRNSISTPTACTSPITVDCTEEKTTSSPSGHIRVAVRVRPLPSGEAGIIEVTGDSAIAIRKEAATGGNQFLATQQGRVEERSFDRVFGPEACQEEVYAWTCEPLIEDAMTQGRNATVFVYGATGAGKTHTMFGTGGEEQEGIIFRAVRDVFDQIDAHTQRASGSDDDLETSDVLEEADRFEVRVSFLELYNEVVRDLLQEGAQSNCKVLEDERRGVVQVSNLVEVLVRSADEALALLRAGMEARTIEATSANSQSSRAHAVFALSVERVRRSPQRRGAFKSRNAEVRIPHSKISLIDLAGSERAKDTHNAGSALKDGARINQSLLALANCIDALTAKGGREGSATSPSLRKKPPYRDSKLTLMLKGSLTGDGLVAMVANVHPGRSHFEDSNNTLEYAMRASIVKPRRRARQSMPATSPPFQVDFMSGQTHVSSRVRRSVTNQIYDQEDCGMASSSTLPPPTPTATERARLRSKRSANDRVAQGTSKETRTKCGTSASAHKDQGHADSAESTASSPGHVSPRDDQEAVPTDVTPEECLSELSLPDDRDGSGDSLEYIGDRCGSEKEQMTNPGKCQDSNASDPDCGVEELKIEVPVDLNVFAAQVIESLQAEKVDFDERLRAVILERDALLQDRAQLEQENARLRAANLEKDRQLIALLNGRSSSPPQAPFTPVE
mmetsp:Transcript_50877/g.80678  ORF Transcript_50877/g.80678 Transcript_50877/m.80678 type:complete len:719 (+) Transcript_50877:56-2212(+)